MARVARADQFHIPGLNPFNCELTSVHSNASLGDQPMIMRDGSVKTISELGDLKYSVVATPDERAEMLEGLGLGEGALFRMVRSAYHLLGVIVRHKSTGQQPRCRQLLRCSAAWPGSI